MNEEQNNFNQNNSNLQNINGIPNNQPLNNQEFNQNINQVQQTINTQPQQNINIQPEPTTSFQQAPSQMNMEQPIQQPLNTIENSETNNNTFNNPMEFNQPQQTTTNQEILHSQETLSMQQEIKQEPLSQPQQINIIENSNINTQNLNTNTPKKFNLGLILGIGAAVVIVGAGIIFGGKILSNNTSNANSNLNSNNQNSVNENTQIEETKSKIKLKNNAKPINIENEQYTMNIDLNWMGSFLNPLDLNNGSYENQTKEFLNKLPGEWEESLSAGNYIDEYVISQDYKLNSESWINISVLANGINNTNDNRVVLTLDMYESLDGIEKDLEKMLELGNIMLGTDLYQYNEIMDGINNLKSKDVRVSLNIKDNDNSNIFGGITLFAGEKWAGSDTTVRMSIQIGTYY